MHIELHGDVLLMAIRSALWSRLLGSAIHKLNMQASPSSALRDRLALPRKQKPQP